MGTVCLQKKKQFTCVQKANTKEYLCDIEFIVLLIISLPSKVNKWHVFNCTKFSCYIIEFGKQFNFKNVLR